MDHTLSGGSTLTSCLHDCLLPEPPSEPVELSSLELPRGQIGEIVISGWHVNTHQVYIYIYLYMANYCSECGSVLKAYSAYTPSIYKDTPEMRTPP